MDDNTAIFKLRYLVKYSDRYEISGFPGVGIGYLIADQSPQAYEEGLEEYRRVVASEPEVSLSMNASLYELYQMTVAHLVIGKMRLAKKLVGELYVGSLSELVRIDDMTLTVKELLDQMIDPGPYYSFILLRNIAGEVVELRKNGMKYAIHSNEQTSHHEPHVHVDSAEYSASIQIGNGKLLDGSLPRKKLKEARQTAVEEARLLIDRWNSESNGIKRDPGVYLRQMSIEIGRPWPEGW